MRGGSKPSNFKLNINNETISDPKLVSEAFNEHFNSIASKLAEEIPRVDFDPLSYVTGSENSFVWFEVLRPLLDLSNLSNVPFMLYQILFSSTVLK